MSDPCPFVEGVQLTFRDLEAIAGDDDVVAIVSTTNLSTVCAMAENLSTVSDVRQRINGNVPSSRARQSTRPGCSRRSILR